MKDVPAFSLLEYLLRHGLWVKSLLQDESKAKVEQAQKYGHEQTNADHHQGVVAGFGPAWPDDLFEFIPRFAEIGE